MTDPYSLVKSSGPAPEKSSSPLMAYLPIVIHHSGGPGAPFFQDKTSPTFLTDAASSAKITTFRNQKKSTASRGIVSILLEITSKS